LKTDFSKQRDANVVLRGEKGGGNRDRREKKNCVVLQKKLEKERGGTSRQNLGGVGVALTSGNVEDGNENERRRKVLGQKALQGSQSQRAKWTAEPQTIHTVLGGGGKSIEEK